MGANLNSPDFKIDESAEPSASVGLVLGYMAERELSDNIYVRFACNYNKRTFEAISRKGIYTSDENWAVDAIEIPVNLGYYLNVNNRNLQFFVDGGFNIGFNFRATTKTTIETIHLDIGSDADIQRMVFGANIGAGLLVKKRLKMRLNYYHGLSSIVNTEGNTWKNKTLGLSLNYFIRDKQVY
tara:strand:+ start:76111 stop:76659 length:549 start_codon:yes stop_codon:yes gene_type:complete